MKLTNIKDCVKRGLIKEGEDPQRVAAEQLIKDEIDVRPKCFCATTSSIEGDRYYTRVVSISRLIKKHPPEERSAASCGDRVRVGESHIMPLKEYLL